MGVPDPDLERLREDVLRELRTFETRMRQHVDDAAARTHEHVDAAQARTRQHVEDLEVRTRQHVENMEVRTRQLVEDTEAGTRQHVEAAEIRTRQHVDATAADTRRHFGVVGEGLLGKIELAAEGLAMLDQKMERFRGEVQESFAKVDRRFLHLEARILSGPEGR